MNKTDNTEKKTWGGYRSLKSYQAATIIYDLTVEFCDLYMTYKTNKSYRTYDQMVQAARSGKQNIAEGSMASQTSKSSELTLVNVARSSLEELLADYEDFLRQKGLSQWEKDSAAAESAANCLICLIHQANYLLDRQIASLKERFVREGGFKENLFKKRTEYRKKGES